MSPITAPEWSPLWNEFQLAAYRNCSVSTVQKERVRGDGPPFLRMGRLIRYRPEDVKAWLDGRIYSSTSQAA